MTTDRDQRTVNALLACHPHVVDDPERGWASAGRRTAIDAAVDLAAPVGRFVASTFASLVDRLASTRLIGPAWPGVEDPWQTLPSLEDSWPDPASDTIDGSDDADERPESPEPADRAA